MRKISNIVLLVLHTAFFVLWFVLASKVLKFDGSKLVIDYYSVYTDNTASIHTISTVRTILGIVVIVLYFFFSFIGQSITKSKLVYTMCAIAVVLPISLAISAGLYFIASIAAYITEILSLINIIMYERKKKPYSVI